MNTLVKDWPPTLNLPKKDKIALPDTIEPDHLSFHKWRGLGQCNKGIFGMPRSHSQRLSQVPQCSLLRGGREAPWTRVSLSFYSRDLHSLVKRPEPLSWKHLQQMCPHPLPSLPMEKLTRDTKLFPHLCLNVGLQVRRIDVKQSLQ
jgi:hypothetical protein